MSANGEAPPPAVMQLAPLELVFTNSNVGVDDAVLPDGSAGKRLVFLHPCGIMATALLPLEAAKNVGSLLLGSGKITVARDLPR